MIDILINIVIHIVINIVIDVIYYDHIRFIIDGGFLSQGGTPKLNGGFIGENPKIKWMMTGGTPIYGNPHFCHEDVHLWYQAQEPFETMEAMEEY